MEYIGFPWMGFSVESKKERVALWAVAADVKRL